MGSGENDQRAAIEEPPADLATEMSLGSRLAAFIEEHGEFVYGICLRYLHNAADAEDATQETFVRIVGSRTALRSQPIDIKRLVATEARRTCYLILRRRRARWSPRVFTRAPFPVDPEVVATDRHLVVEVLGRVLTPYERMVMAHNLAGYPDQEVAHRLGRDVGAISQALSRARQRARRFRGEVLGLLLPPRVRRAAADAARWVNSRTVALTAFAADPARSLTLSTVSAAVVSLLASAAAPPSPAVAGASAGRVVVGADPGWGPATKSHTSNASSSSSPPDAPGSGRGSHALPLDLRLPPFSTPLDAPQNTRLVDAEPSPNYAHDRTVVALGLGTTCGCQVLFRSKDGGVTWDAAPGPPSLGDQLVLPPDYPHDSRIFVGSPAPNYLEDFVTPSFGMSFEVLPVSAGHLAVSSRFDTGDPRLFVASVGAVWTYDVDSGARSVAITFPDAETASVATASGSSTAIFALAPPNAVALSPISGGLAPAIGPGPILFACATATSVCTRLASLPFAAPGSLAVSHDFALDRTVVAYSPTQIELSTDGGQTFSSVAVPTGTELIRSVALSPLPRGGISLWLSVRLPSGAVVIRAALPVHSWEQGTRAVPDPLHAGAVVPLSSMRALSIASDAGYRCTADGGRTWSRGCPSEK